LISCRNLLIYLEPVLQKQVLPTLHYALKPSGVLWLGSSETASVASHLFAPEDKKHRFYSKKPAAAHLRFRSARGDAARDRADSGQKRNHMGEQLLTERDAEKEADRIILARYSPASVLVSSEMEILQFRGSTGAYLEAPSGKATLNLLKMAREGLMLPLRAAIQKAKKDDATVRKEDVRVNYGGEFRQVNLEVVPIKGLAANERSFLVLFEPATLEPGAPATRKAKTTTKRQTEDRQVARLQEELAATREYLQSLVEQHEAANEELQSSSEEIQSANEELQSINDELHNLHANANIPMLFLDRDLRIRRFTPQAEKVLNLIAADLERPVGDTGEGISADFLPYVFARFRQADGTTTRQHGGLGLGLAIVRHLVEAHGGQVRAASEGAGQGATFTVTLPLAGRRREGETEGGRDFSSPFSPFSPSLRPSVPPPSVPAGLRVLVVDDDRDSRELLRLALTEEGAEVRTAASAAEALDIFNQWEQWRPDVLVSDIGMPGEDGYELMRQVRALPAERGGQAPAVALTGYVRPEDQKRALAAGYQMFVPKPVEMDKLVTAIARLAATG